MHDIIPSQVEKHFKGHFKEAKTCFFQTILSMKCAEDMATLAFPNSKFK